MHERVYDVGGVDGLGSEQAESSFLCPQTLQESSL